MSEMQSRHDFVLPDVISIDQLPDAPTAKQAAPDVIDINTLPDAIDINSLPDAQPSQPVLPDAGFGTFADSVGRSFNEFYAQRGISDRVRIEAMLRELDAGGNPDINPVKTWGDSIKMDIGRAIGAKVDTPDVKRQYLLNRLGQIDEEIKSSDAAVKSYGQGSQQLSDLQAGLQEALKKDSFLSKTGSAFSALYDNPAGIPELIGGGAYTMGRPIAAGIAAAYLSKGRTLAPMVTSAAVSGADSYDGTMAEIIEQKGREGGIDVRKNPEAIPTLLQDAGFIEAAKGEALRRGISDAAWSAISMRLGMSPKIKGVWQPVVQSAAEAGTEISGQVAQKGKVYDPTAVPVALTTGFAFEGPSYALGRAAGAFGKPEANAQPAAPSAQAQPQTQAAPVAPATPDVIDVDSLPDAPSVAGETAVSTPPIVPAMPAPQATSPAPVQPAAEQPAPVEQPAPDPTEQPRATAAELQEQLNQANAREEAAGAALDVALAKWKQLLAASQQDPENQELAAVANEASEAAVAATDAWRATQRDVESARSMLESETARAGLEAASAPATPPPAAQPAPAAATPVAEPAPAQTPAPAVEAAQPAPPQTNAQRLKAEVGKLEGLSALALEDYTESEVEIANIEAAQKGAGAGTKAMQSIVDAADRLGINLMLIPAGDDQKRARLEDFYGRFGFESDGDVMRRRAQPAAPQAEAAPAPVKPTAPAQPTTQQQTEIPGTADTFNLTGEQVSAPRETAQDTTAEIPLGETRESPLVTEARARLAKLEAAGKGDSEQAAALRRTIERETKPAEQQKAKGLTVEIMGKKYPVASMQEASVRWLAATKQIEDNGVSLNRDTGLKENLWSGDGPVVRDADGKIVGYIAQNGRISKDRSNAGDSNFIYTPTDEDYDAAGYEKEQPVAQKPEGSEPEEVRLARQEVANPKSIDSLNAAWDTIFKYEKKGKYAIETAQEAPAAEQPKAQPQQGDLPADATDTVDKVKQLSGANLSEAAAAEIEIRSEEGLQTDFVEEAGIKNLKDHLNDLLERLETSLDAARTSGRDGATPSEQRKAVNAAKDAIKAVEAAIAKLGQDGDQTPAAKPQAQPATQPKAEPDVNEAAKAKKTDQTQTKRARTALRNAIRQFGQKDKRTLKKYRAVLDALDREGFRDQQAKDVSQPYLGLDEPSDVKAARELLAKKARKTSGITNDDARKANNLIEQYEAEVDLARGQLRDDDQIKLVSDETLNRVVEHVQGMLDAGLNPDADAMIAMRLASDEIERRAQIDPEAFGDPIADVKKMVRQSGVGIPLLPVVETEKGNIAWKDTEYSGLKENLPSELSLEGGVFIEPKVEKQGIDLDRARTDANYRKNVAIAAEGMMGKLMEYMQELGWTQLQSGFDIVTLLSDASDGKPQAPEGGVGGASFKGDPGTVAKLHGGEVKLDMLGSEGQVNADEQVDTREPEPSDEEKQTALQMEVEYEDPRYDAQPSPADQAVLDAAADNAPTEQSILDALDKAARERLDPRNRNSLGPDLIAALMWQTARDIQRGVVSFAKWSADKARQFPSLKGSLNTIWAKAQDIAKRPMDYIRFRALDSIADKVWQNASRNKGSATLRKIANIVFAKAGPDADATENDIPTRVNLVRNQFSNIYAGIMERFAAEFADMSAEQRRQWDADFRKAVIEGTTPSDPKVAKAVQDFRNLMKAMLAYQRDAGITMGDQGGNYFPRNYDPDAVEANRDGFIDAAMEMYRKRDERILKADIERIQKSVAARALERKEADRKFGRKIKSDAEYQQEAAEWAQEKIADLEAEHDAKDDDYYKQKAEDWATAITHGDVLGLTLFKATEGKVTSDATDARTFNNDEAKLADEFLKKNVDDIMLGYIDGAVRGAELARVFGEDGKKFEQMMNKLSAEGVDAETVKETARLVQKALGVGREQQSQATAAFFDWVNVVLAGAFLGKTFMYNLVLEPISFGIRTGNIYLALKGMTDTWKYTLAEIGKPSPAMRQRIEAKYGSQKAFAKAVTETVGEQVGLIQNEMERSYFNAHWDYSSGEKGSRMAKWISQRIYRANLMSATEKAKVQASIGIARLALRDNARFFTGDAPIQKLFSRLGMDTSADKSAGAILRENGVPEKDHKAFAAFVAGLDGKTDAEWQRAVMDPKDPMAKHYRRALQRMSLGMSIKTNPALKMEMADSVMGRLMMQLMNYSYAYSNLVKDRMYSMAAATASKDASKIDRLRYAAPLLVGAPLAIMGAAASKALIAAMWPSDDEEKRSKETPMVRKAFNWASFAGMFGPKIEYLFKSFERGQAPGGPVGETIFRGGQAAFAAAGDPDSEKKAYNAKKQLYNSTVKPIVTGSGAAAHPFFGFLGNAAVNTQDVREAVTGEPPRR